MNFVFKIKVVDKSGEVMAVDVLELTKFRADKLGMLAILKDIEYVLPRRWPDADMDKTRVHLLELIDSEGMKYVPKVPVLDLLDAAEAFFDGEAVQWIPEHLKDKMEKLMENVAKLRQEYE